MKFPFLSSMLLLGVVVTSSARADVVATRSGNFTGTVLRKEKDTLIFRTERGEFPVPLKDIVRLDIPEPSDYQDGVAAFKKGDWSTAIAKLKPVVDRLGGLPVPWIRDATWRLADSQLLAKDHKAAKRSFEDFKAKYPDAAEVVGIPLKLAHIQVYQKKCAEATPAVEQVRAELLKKEFLNSHEEALMAEAALILGDCLLADGKKTEALDWYLQVTVLYDVDPVRSVEALFKAGQLFEQAGNWRRAKSAYEELIARAETSPWASAAQERLAAIAQNPPP